jgi:hypothetical protein
MPASPRGGYPGRGWTATRIAALATRPRGPGGAGSRLGLERAAGFAGALTGSVTALTLSVLPGALSAGRERLFFAYGSRH